MYTRIKTDIVTAMKDGDEVKKNLLRVLAGDCSKDIKFPSNDVVIATIKSFLKKNAELIEHIEKRGYTDAHNAYREKDILESYLPKQMTAEELKFTIAILIENGSKDMKSIMADLKVNFKDRYNGKMASDTVRELLNT